MCGRITLITPDEVLRYFNLPEAPTLTPRFNIAPTQSVAVIRFDATRGRRALDLLRWGLVPAWAQDIGMGSRLVNARAETAAQKPAFRDGIRKRRCIIPVDGFYEWQKRPRGKQPYWIRARDRMPLALGGLWERNTLAVPEALETFTILTTPANELIQPLHDRMPLILDARDWDVWLDPAVGEPTTLAPLLKPYPAAQMTKQPVSDWVNSAAHEGARCIEPPAAEPAAAPLRKRKSYDDFQGRLFE